MAREVEKQRQAEQKLKDDSRLTYYLSQNSLLKEKLEKAKADRKIMEKAHQDELRSMRREQKERIRLEMSKFKEKLEGDFENDNRKEEIEKLKGSIQADIRSKK
jgi:hypothetical protein